MAPKAANKAKAVLKESKGKFAEALQDAIQKEAAATDDTMAEAGKRVLKRPAAAVDTEAEPQKVKVLKRPAAATVQEEADVEEPEAEDIAEAEVEEPDEDEDEEVDEDEVDAKKVMKKPAAASAAPKPVAQAAPAAKDAAATKAKAAEAAQQPAAEAAQEPAEPAPKKEKQPKPVSRTQELINAVHSTITSIVHKASPAAGVKLHPAALTTFDEEGFPSTRTVIPHFIADDLTEIRLTSQAGTRKEVEISANPKASLHFQDQRGKGGWVTLKGQATVRPAGNADKVEIVLKPIRCEVMSYNESVMGDADGWKPATMVMAGGTSWRRTDAAIAAANA